MGLKEIIKSTPAVGLARRVRRHLEAFSGSNRFGQIRDLLRTLSGRLQEEMPGAEIRIAPTGDVFLYSPKHHLDFAVPLDSREKIKIGNYDGFEETETRLLVQAMRKGTAFLDIGANVGVHSLRVAAACPEARIYSLEPVSANFRLLEKNVLRNGLQARIRFARLCLGDSEGDAEIPLGVGTWQFVTSKADKRSSAGISVEKVRMTTVDAFVREAAIDKVSVIKCGVEGFEYFVLLGARRTLESHRPAVLLECTESFSRRFDYEAPRIFEFFHELGYGYRCLMPGGLIERSGSSPTLDLSRTSNFFFFPSERHADFDESSTR